MITAVVLGDISVLDKRKIREAVIRIPEVVVRVRQAQDIIDTLETSSVDLFTCLSLEDSSFTQLGTVRSILVSAVQLGLYDRFIKKNGKPQYILGLKGSLPLLNTLAGSSELSNLMGPLIAAEPSAQVLTLVGSRSSYDILKIEIDSTILPSVQVIESTALNIEQLVTLLVENYSVNRIVNIGPSSPAITPQTVDPIYERLQICESIDIDPMLYWFNRQITA